MKKSIFVLATMMVGSLLFAQVGPEGTKEEVKEDSNLKNIRIAYDLADYGYENESASALLEAAEILCQVSKKEAEDITTKQEGTSGDKAPTATKSYKSIDLVKAAKTFAGKDKAMLEWAKAVEKKAKISTRGASGGAVYKEDFVYSRGRTIHDIRFNGGRFAEIGVHSLDGADLDLYIYDENDNLIAYDERNAQNAYCSFNPRWTGVFQIIVKNNARYNAVYELFTN